MDIPSDMGENPLGDWLVVNRKKKGQQNKGEPDRKDRVNYFKNQFDILEQDNDSCDNRETRAAVTNASVAYYY